MGLGIAVAAASTSPTSASQAFGRRTFAGIAFSSATLARPASAVVLGQSPPAWVPEGDASDPAAYFTQLRAGQSEMRRCLKDWTALTHADRDTDFDGDAVRRIIGTVGTASPLLRIDKVFATIRKGILASSDPRYEDVDVERFVELSEAVVQGLRDTDYLAYSAIFADPSGNAGVPGKSSKDFLEKTRLELAATLRKYDELLKLLSL